tara:strand:- start:803 stop:1747 length:945 start_codon:yes stop_codon:yes gene_type:complete
MNIVYFGDNNRSLKVLEALYEEGYHINALTVHNGEVLQNPSNPILKFVKNRGVPIFDPANVNDAPYLQTLKKVNPDLLILCGYNQILKKDILKIPKRGAINLHGGRLPYYRGGSPINWQIINGETKGGCAILQVDNGIDTGDILDQQLYDIGLNETAGEVTLKTFEIFQRMLPKVLSEMENDTLRFQKQERTDGSYYCKRYPRDGLIHWDKMNALEVHNLVRALNGPNLPGAFTYLDNKKFVILKTKVLSEKIRGIPGRIALKNSEGVIVIAKDHGILVTEIKSDNEEESLETNQVFKIAGLTFDCNSQLFGKI